MVPDQRLGPCFRPLLPAHPQHLCQTVFPLTSSSIISLLTQNPCSTESQSLSNTTRKNPHPPTTTRKCIGNRYDGLITHNRLEYGAIEDSKDYEYKKWASDSLKLVKVLHDQLRGLEAEVRHVTTALEGFRCVGFLTAGKLPIAFFPG